MDLYDIWSDGLYYDTILQLSEQGDSQSEGTLDVTPSLIGQRRGFKDFERFCSLSIIKLFGVSGNKTANVSNHRPFDCLLNGLFRRRSKKISKLRVTGLCEGNPPVTGEFPAQRDSNAESGSIWWRHHVHELIVFYELIDYPLTIFTAWGEYFEPQKFVVMKALSLLVCPQLVSLQPTTNLRDRLIVIIK